jgi:hypothetical protein
MGGHWTLRAPADYRFVDLDDPAEAEYWLLVLDASRRELEDAVARVGHHVLAVQGYLRGRRSEAAPSRI